MTAIDSFEAAGLPHEVAISSSCAISDFGSVGNMQLAWECESRARSYFEAKGDRLRLARLRLNVSSIFYARAEWSTAALLIDLSQQDLIAESYGGSGPRHHHDQPIGLLSTPRRVSSGEPPP